MSYEQSQSPLLLSRCWPALGVPGTHSVTVIAEIAWREQAFQAADRGRVRHPRFTPTAGKMTDDVRGRQATQDRWVFHAAYWPDLARQLPKGERSKFDRPHGTTSIFRCSWMPPIMCAHKLTVNLASDYRVTSDKRNSMCFNQSATREQRLQATPGPTRRRSPIAGCSISLETFTSHAIRQRFSA
jgi:hypothetical protein